MSTLSNFDSTVNSFYLAFYGRPADPAGLKFWSQQLAANNGELGAITQAFAMSEEAQVRFGTDSLNERIGEIYQQLFNRTIDADGLAYWTGVVEQGDASLADVSIAILNGARDSDATLSAMRQKAVDDFTAQVEASGSQYGGYASIEAARILVRAVTADATDADLAQLVKSAVSFADTATKSPAVVEAIAINTTLLALFDTARGKGDPVALAQALADTAKAAAGDSVTLESLLRGGGMDKVLKVMPAAASLKDVVKALAEGGLPAAVEVVYPSAPVDATPTPTPQPEKTFILGGLEHTLTISGTATDNVIVDLTTNTILRNGHNPMGSMNDITGVFAKDYAGKVTVTGKVSEIFVAMSDADTNGVNGYGIIDVKSAIFNGEPGARQFVSHEIEALFERVNLVRLMDTFSMEERALFDSLQGFDITKLSVEVDEQVPEAPLVALDVDSGIFPTAEMDHVTKVGDYSVKAEEGATVQFSMNGMDDWSTTKPLAQKGENAFFVRQIDQAGNIGNSVEFKFTLATEKPAAPVVKLETDTGIKGDDISAVGDIRVTGLTPGLTTVQYRTSSDGQWQGGFLIGNTDTVLLKASTEGTNYIEVRQVDQAGNEGAIASLSYVVDPNAPQPPAAVPPSFTIKPTTEGIDITANVAGKIWMSGPKGDVDLKSTDPTSGAIAGTTTLAMQDKAAMGMIFVTPTGGQAITAVGNGDYYYLGGSGYDSLSGRYQWGFDGDDILTGTTSGDFLSGGDGGDIILSKGGSDTISGGSGADKITMLVDGIASRLLYEAGDTYIGQIHSGEPAMDIDRVRGAEAGDVIDLGTVFKVAPSLVGKELLTSIARGQVALVRGNDVEGSFTVDATGNDYMVQWTDGNGINSILLADYSGANLALNVDPDAGTLTLVEPPAPVLSAYVSTQFQLGGLVDQAIISLEGASITGVADPSGFALQHYSLASSVDVQGYEGAPGAIGIGQTGAVQLKTPLATGMYKMSWTDATFATGEGFVKSGEVFFAGGQDGPFHHQGFALEDFKEYLGGANYGNAVSMNQGFSTSPLANGAIIHTGGGNDVVIDTGGRLIVEYDAIDDAAQDLIFGFRSDDRVRISGDVAALIEKDGNEGIKWNADVADGTTEGLMVTVSDHISLGPTADMEWIAAVLNNHVDLSGVGKGEHLLILVNGVEADSNVLFFYQNLQHDGMVQGNELTTIAMFADGAIAASNIELAGLPPALEIYG